MAKVSVTTDEGELVEMLEDGDLPSSKTGASMAGLGETVWTAIVRARKLDPPPCEHDWVSRGKGLAQCRLCGEVDEADRENWEDR